jgi:hypothetical protein
MNANRPTSTTEISKSTKSNQPNNTPNQQTSSAPIRTPADDTPPHFNLYKKKKEPPLLQVNRKKARTNQIQTTPITFFQIQSQTTKTSQTSTTELIRGPATCRGRYFINKGNV